MVYDTALRIGAKLRLMPRRVSCTLEPGLVLSRSVSTTEMESRTLRPAAESRALEPHEVEDCLCIYKAALELMAVPEGPERFVPRSSVHAQSRDRIAGPADM